MTDCLMAAFVRGVKVTYWWEGNDEEDGDWNEPAELHSVAKAVSN